MMILLLALSGYLLGSVPLAWLVARWVTGKDLRSIGSGNVGVMNVALSVARWAGLLVFAGEAAKGLAAVALARALDGSELAIGVTVIATVVGTRWMLWLRFAGGRGNTAGLAAMLVISWQAFISGFALWGVVRLVSKSSFWATRVSLILWPFIFGAWTGSWLYLLCGMSLSAVYLTSHQVGSDDHTMIKERWPSLWAFLTGPKRR